jgi:hypothetical protein
MIENTSDLSAPQAADGSPGPSGPAAWAGNRSRSIGNVPFCWQDKRVLRKIRDSFDSQNTVASALATYHALCVIASDSGTNEFVTTIPWIASMCGLSPRTVGPRLADLQRIGVIRVRQPRLKAPCTYQLLPFGDDCPTSGNGCRTLSNGCRTFGKPEAPRLPTSEEREEKKVHSPAGEDSEVAWPSWEQWWGYCNLIGMVAEWKARDEWQKQESRRWAGIHQWQRHAERVKGWWEADGRPMQSPSRTRQTTKEAQQRDYKSGF